MIKVLKYSFYLSLIAQLIIVLITFHGFFIPVTEEDKPLKNGMVIENIVQYVEFTFYIIMLFIIKKLNIVNITNVRYIDWVITTPLMLLSTVIVMKYFENKENKEKQFSLTEFLNEYKFTLGKILIFNLFMLLFGYLGDINVISKFNSLWIGFVFFALVFYEIYVVFIKDKNIKINNNLYIFVFIIWSLYGCVAMIPGIKKDIIYNILDVISKNFYALFLYYKLRRLPKIENE